MIRKLLVIVGLGGAASLVMGVQLLYSQRRPQLVMTPPEEKRLIVEEVYQFTIQRYDPRVEVKLLSSPSQASLVTPEGTVIAFLSAFARIDIDWLASLKTQHELKRREAEQPALDPQARRKQEEDLYRKQAEYLFKGRRVFLTRRLQVAEDIVVVEMTSVPEQPGARVSPPLPWTLTLVQRQWKMGVRTLEEEFVYSYITGHYEFPGTEKKINPFPGGIAVSTSKPVEGLFYHRFQEEGGKR